jgi:ribosomal protein S18
VFAQLGLDPVREATNRELMSNFVSDMGKIRGRAETELTRKSQRRLGKAIRRAKMMGLTPVLSRDLPRNLLTAPGAVCVLTSTLPTMSLNSVTEGVTDARTRLPSFVWVKDGFRRNMLAKSLNTVKIFVATGISSSRHKHKHRGKTKRIPLILILVASEDPRALS